MFIPHLEPWSVLAVASIVALVVYLSPSSGSGARGCVALVADAGLGRRTASLFAVTGTWMNGYSMVLFSVHMTA